MAEAFAWLAGARGRTVMLLLLVLLLGQLGVAWYESSRLGLPLVREEPAGFDLRHLLQSAFALGVSASLAVVLVRSRAQDSLLDRESCQPVELWTAFAALAAAAAATVLFIVDPAAFHTGAQEDRPLEWASALLLLGAGAVLLVHALRRRRERLTLLLGAGLALVLVVIGMEEISWGQRIFGFATPEQLAEMNWQAEFNFHNVQTDLSETLYYAGATAFLVVLPLLRDLLPPSVASHPWFALTPRRSAALVGAPVAGFTYGHWNLLPIQLGCWLALWALIAWARAAARRGARGEQIVFLVAAGFLVACQAVFLAFGATMVDLPDATEYKEFFIGVGFAFYAATVAFPRPAPERR